MPTSDAVLEIVEQARRSLDDFTADFAEQIAGLAALIINAYKSKRKVLFMGNGGSAADAQHLATELVGRFFKERAALEAVALNTNTSLITALGNDYGFEHTFRRQIEALAHEGDVVIGLSTSGDSANVLMALEEAKRRGCHTVGLTGGAGGSMKDAVDMCLCAPSGITPRIQENHILIGHIVCELVERQLFGDAG